MDNLAAITAYTYILGSKLVYTPRDLINKHPYLPKSRTLSCEHELPRHLAEQCAHKLIDSYHIRPDSIDLILYSSSFPDTVNIGFGPYVQKSIGAINASVLQVDCACASWGAQLEVAKSLINTGAHQRILVISVSQMISRLEQAILQIPGRLLGEGATAFMLERGKANFDIYLERTAGIRLAQVYPERSEDHDWHSEASPLLFLSEDLYANRPDKAVLELINKAITKLLVRHNLMLRDIDYLLCSSPDGEFLDVVADKLNFPRQQIISSFDSTGDLAQASIGTSLARLSEEGSLAGKKIAFIDFSRDGQHLGAGIIAEGLLQ